MLFKNKMTSYIFILFLMLISYQIIINSNYSLFETLYKKIDFSFTDVQRITNDDEVDYSIFSDELICDKVPHVDFYPELNGFVDEANRRGIKCYYFTTGHYSTNNPVGFVSDIPLPVSKP